MRPPILFIDDKKEEPERIEFRFRRLEKELNEFSDLIEFSGDVVLNTGKDSQTGEEIYIPDPYLDDRKLVFIHSSYNKPGETDKTINSASTINQAKLYHQKTIFARFSGESSYFRNLDGLVFNRTKHIYNYEDNTMYNFIRFFKNFDWFEFDILTKEPGSLLKRVEEVENYMNRIQMQFKLKKEISEIISSYDFDDLLRISLNNREIIKAVKQYFTTITNHEEFIAKLAPFRDEVEKKMPSYNQFYSL
jgi:hypothetical protein